MLKHLETPLQISETGESRVQSAGRVPTYSPVTGSSSRGVQVEALTSADPLKAEKWRATHLQFSKTPRKHSSDPSTSRLRRRSLASVRPLFMLMLSGSRFPISE